MLRKRLSSAPTVPLHGLFVRCAAKADSDRGTPPSDLFTPGTVNGSLCGCLCDNGSMATNLAIDPRLLERALALSGEKTKTRAVTMALQEFVARREQARVVDLFGTLDWDPDFDYKAERSRP